MNPGGSQGQNLNFNAGGERHQDASVMAARLSLLPLLAGFLALAGCKPGQPMGPPPERIVQVVIAQAKRQPVAETLALVGSILADEMVELKSETDGVVESIHFLEGQEVQEGALLVQLDQTKLAQALAETESNLKLSQANFDRNQQLFNEKLIAQQEFDQSSAILHFNQATVNLRRRQLEDTRIVAPFAGVVGARMVSPGQVISKNTTLTWLVDLDPVKVEINVPERFLGQLHTGQSIEISVAAFPGKTFTGQVFFVAPFVDPETRTALVKASIPNADHALKPGMFASLQLTLTVRDNSIVIPEEGLAKFLDNNEALVFIRDSSGLAQMKKVKIGMRLPGQAEILQGLNGDESIIVEGSQKLAPGVKVRVAAPKTQSEGSHRGPEPPSQGNPPP